MKNKISWVIIALLSVFSKTAIGQTYADAIALASYLDVNSKFPKNDPRVDAILGKYDGSIKYGDNPFIDPFFTPVEHTRFALGYAGAAAGPLAGIGQTNVTSIADGLGKFLAKRTKQEINIAFFERFNVFLQAHPEIKQLFPTTTKYLNDIFSYESTTMLSTLRAAFESDLKGLLKNIAAIGSITEDQCNCKNTTQLNKCKERIKVIKAFFDTEYGQIVISGLTIADGAINHKKPDQIISDLAGSKSLSGDIHNSLKLLDIFSKALGSQNSNAIWASGAELAPLMANNNALQIYLGLLYQRIALGNITIGTAVVADEIKSFITTSGLVTVKANLITYVQDMDKALTDLQTSYAALKKDKSCDTTNELILAHAGQFIASFKQTLEQAIQYDKISTTIPPPGDKFMAVFNCVDTTLQIAEMILAKNYYGAILSSALLIDQVTNTQAKINAKGLIVDKEKAKLLNNKHLPKLKNISEITYAAGLLTINGRQYTAPQDLKTRLEYDNSDVLKTTKKYLQNDDIMLTKKTFMRNVFVYGNFMANLVSAKNSDDAEKAIESIALPPGSASIKRTTNFNICIQAYTGISTAIAPISSAGFNSASISAPVGVAFSFGLKDWKNPFDKRTKGSLSAFFSLVDVGAIVAYRFDHAETKLNDTVNVRLENIFAPGVSLIYGIPHVPLSIGAGTQWQPSLQRFSSDGTTIVASSGWRFQVFLGFDLPLLNIHSSAK